MRFHREIGDMLSQLEVAGEPVVPTELREVVVEDAEGQAVYGWEFLAARVRVRVDTNRREVLAGFPQDEESTASTLAEELAAIQAGTEDTLPRVRWRSGRWTGRGWLGRMRRFLEMLVRYPEEATWNSLAAQSVGHVSLCLPELRPHRNGLSDAPRRSGAPRSKMPLQWEPLVLESFHNIGRQQREAQRFYMQVPRARLYGGDRANVPCQQFTPEALDLGPETHRAQYNQHPAPRGRLTGEDTDG